MVYSVFSNTLSRVSRAQQRKPRGASAACGAWARGSAAGVLGTASLSLRIGGSLASCWELVSRPPPPRCTVAWLIDKISYRFFGWLIMRPHARSFHFVGVHFAFAMSFISMGDVDLLHPPKELEQRRHKLKRLVQSPNSFFMDVKCPGCFNITTVRSCPSPEYTHTQLLGFNIATAPTPLDPPQPNPPSHPQPNRCHHHHHLQHPRRHHHVLLPLASS